MSTTEVLSFFEVQWKISSTRIGYHGNVLEDGQWFLGDKPIGTFCRKNHQHGCKIRCEWRYMSNASNTSNTSSGSKYFRKIQPAILDADVTSEFVQPQYVL